MQEWRVRSAVENVLVLSRTVQYNDFCEKRQYLVERRDHVLKPCQPTSHCPIAVHVARSPSHGSRENY
ncbi:hypothetical protein L3Y34_011540 [Caenorhabditis briggsae]|uniref:Uncharacterized protein n=1 Tax=Caenorhabditis briggsae TaxID=6238 RepID=A0AAE9CV63_CAEBR|nr:hypothetical protein L3Y34_011540 [Caenorhabditis briggsae]